MPMGVLNDDDFLSEMSNTDEDKKKESHTIASVEDIKRGRTKDTKEIPEEIRELAAKSLINGEGTLSQVASAYGISSSSASAYKVGAHSTTTYDSPNPALLSKITDHKTKISNKARSRLLSALNGITPDKLEGTKARDLASIAKDMASIVKDMEPPMPGLGQTNNVQFVFMAPRVKEIDNYNVIDIKE